MTFSRSLHPRRRVQTTPPSYHSPGGSFFARRGKNHAIYWNPVIVLLAQGLSASFRFSQDIALLIALCLREQEVCQPGGRRAADRQRREDTCGSGKLAWNVRVGGPEPGWRVRKGPIPERLGGRSAPYFFHSQKVVIHNPL